MITLTLEIRPLTIVDIRSFCQGRLSSENFVRVVRTQDGRDGRVGGTGLQPSGSGEGKFGGLGLGLFFLSGDESFDL